MAFYSYPPNEAANPYFVEAYAQRLGVAITDGTISSYNAIFELGGGAAQTILSGTTQNGIECYFRGSAAGTSTVRAGYFIGASNASAYTLSFLTAAQADLVVNASSTVTRGVNLYLGSVSVSGTLTNRAAIADNASFTGSWFLNSTSTNPSRIAGNLGIGGDSNPAYGLFISSSALTTTDQVGINISYSGTSAATNVIYGASSSATTANSSFTCAFLSQYAANNPAKGAASTITRQLGYYVATPTQGTNNASIADNAAFVGSFFINSTTVNKSFLTGALALARFDVASAATITALDSTRSFVKLTGVTATALQGITAGVDGQRLTVVNLTGSNLTVQNENAGATAANRITTMTGADVATTANGAAEFVYDTGSSRWICLYVSP